MIELILKEPNLTQELLDLSAKVLIDHCRRSKCRECCYSAAGQCRIGQPGTWKLPKQKGEV